MVDSSRLMRNRFTQRFSRHWGGVAPLCLLAALALWVPLSTADAADIKTQSADTGATKDSSNVNDIPPRLQWTANFGYCGEVAFISAGLYYGQYVSQYDARAIASKSTKQSMKGSQLLPGVNDAFAAAQMHLKAVQWKSSTTPDTHNFLAWIKDNVTSGYPVIIGIYENMQAFEGSTGPTAGDNTYDHIVLVTGVSSKHPLTRPSLYYADDMITFSDHGLWSPDGPPAYLYQFPFGSSQANRREANEDAHPIYSLPRSVSNHGVAITGIVDHDGQALPVRLSTDPNDEKPAMGEGSNTRPASAPVTLTVTVSDLKPGTAYTLYRYDSFQAVPESAFNGNASKADREWKISIKAGSTYTMRETIRSDQVAVYRAVPVTAP